jgi:hypothetical protein
VTFSDQTERALRNVAASQALIIRASAFFESNRAAIDQALQTYQAAAASDALERFQHVFDSQLAGVEKALKDAGGMTTLEQTFRRASASIAGMDAVMNTGAFQSLRDWSFHDPEVQAAAASATAAALVGVADNSLTVEALHEEIAEAAVAVSYDKLLPEVSGAAAARFGVWMVVAPTLLFMWDDPLVGPWLQTHIELVAFLIGLTMWGLRGVITPQSEK